MKIISSSAVSKEKGYPEETKIQADMYDMPYIYKKWNKDFYISMAKRRLKIGIVHKFGKLTAARVRPKNEEKIDIDFINTIIVAPFIS